MKIKIDIKDFLWFSIIAFTILTFSSIPYWKGTSAETEEVIFSGAYFDEMDYSVHISMMQAGRMGDWAYQMRFTSEEHRPVFLRMFYIILGHISKWINLSAETTYHLARWVFGFIALYSIYKLCLRIFQEKKLTYAAFLLCVLGGGAGWLQLVFNGDTLKSLAPIDFWLTDAYVFFSVSIFPAFSFTLALMAIALNLFLDYLNTKKWGTVFFISLLAVASQITNPIAFAVIDIFFASAIFFLWQQNNKIDLRQFHALVVIAAVQIPLLVYNFLILDRDPLWRQFTLQNETFSPPPNYYAWGFAPFWILAIYGVILGFREKNINMTAMSTWVISGFILAYLPLLIQRRFLFGITIPLGILAIYGANHLIKQVSIKMHGILKRERLFYITYIFLSSISFINLSLGSSLYLQARPSDNFYPRDLGDAMIWLDKHAVPNDFVLGNVRTGQLVAQRTKLKTYVGHPIETFFFDDKVAALQAYYQGKSSDRWIQQTPINWVIYGPYEKEISSLFRVYPHLELVYKNDTVIIYKVKR